MDFAWVLAQLEDRLTAANIDHALIGGFAMAALGFNRATGDLDYLIDGQRAEDTDRILHELGFTALYRSSNVANYASDNPRLGGVDVLYANRPHTRAMLASALLVRIGTQQVKVVQGADLIGLKLQAAVNDPRRAGLDFSDIEHLLATLAEADLNKVRDYFRLFDRETELDELLLRIKR